MTDVNGGMVDGGWWELVRLKLKLELGLKIRELEVGL
jgi:hypothetical protein